jgi:hypoxia-inducible factor (prolyl hydroxylase)
VICDKAINGLNDMGIAVIDNFLGQVEGQAILDEVLTLYGRNYFKDGKLVNPLDGVVVRGDKTFCVSGLDPWCRRIGELIQALDTMVSRCGLLQRNTKSDLSKCRIETRSQAMIACYPGEGSQYLRHVDNPHGDGRCLTAIYYLNKEWDKERDGGLLRLFPTQRMDVVANIAPEFDRLILFWSDRRNPHEVHPSFRLRFAITVWYYNSEERQTHVDKIIANGKLPVPIDYQLNPFDHLVELPPESPDIAHQFSGQC